MTDVEGVIPQLVAIWREVLDSQAVDEDSDLLAHGGTSLDALRIRFRIQADLGKEVDLLSILDHPTPRGVAEVVVHGG